MRTNPRAVVLQTTINAVAILVVVHVDGVELTQWWSISFQPVLTTIVANIDPPIVTIDQVVRPVGVDPQRVVVGVDVVGVDAAPGLAGVITTDDGYAEGIHRVWVISRSPDLPEVVAVGIVQTVDELFVRPLPGLAVSSGDVEFEAFNRGVKQQRIGVLQILYQHLWVNTVASHVGQNGVCRKVLGEAAAA